MKSIIRLVLVAVIAIIGYNYFYGTTEEKAQSKEIVDEVADSSKKIIGSIGKLLKSEKEKFDDGKYDEAMGDLKGIFNNLKKEANSRGSEIQQEVEALELKRKDLEQEIEKSEDQPNNKKNTEKLKEDFEKLTEAAKILVEKMRKE